MTTQTTDAVQATEASGAVTEPEVVAGETKVAEEAQAPTETEPSELPQIRSRARERIQTLIAENKALKSQLEATEETEAETEAPLRDERGRFVPAETPSADEDLFETIDGEQIPKKFAARHLSVEEKLAAIERKLTDREQAEFEAQQAAAWGRVYAEGEKALVEIIGKSFPTLQPDIRREVEEVAIQSAAQHVMAKTGGDTAKLTEEILMESLDVSMKRLGRLLSVGAPAQAADNQRYAEQHPVRAGGTPGTAPAKTLDQMTGKEIEEAALRARRFAEAQRAAER